MSDYHVSVDAGLSKLIEDAPTLVEEAQSASFMTGADFSDSVLEASLGGIYEQFRKYYNYGAHHYTFGLPDTNTFSLLQTPDEVNSVIASLEPDYTTKITSYTYGVPIPLFYGLKYNKEELNDPNPRGIKWFFKQFTPFNTTYSPYTVKLAYKIDQTDSGEVIETDVIFYDNRYKFYQIEYEVYDDDVLIDTKYFDYYPPTGTYPTLTGDLEVVLRNSFMPVVPVKVQGKMVNEMDRDDDLVHSSSELLKRLNVNLDDISESFKSSPTSGDIDNAYVFLGVNVNEDKDYIKYYAYLFFKFLYENTVYTKDVYEEWIATGEQVYATSSSALLLQDPYFSFYFLMQYTTVETEQRVIGPVHSIISEQDSNKRKFIAQVTPTECEVVTVVGLRHNLSVLGTQRSTGMPLIPISMDVLRTLPIKYRRNVCYASIHLVYSAYEFTRVKWYENHFVQFFVKAVLTVGAVTYALVTGGAGTFASASVLESVLYAGSYALEAYLLASGFNYLIKHTSPELAVFLGTVAAIAGSVSGPTLFRQIALELALGTNLGVDLYYKEKWQHLQDEYEAFIEQDVKKLEETQKLLRDSRNSMYLGKSYNPNNLRFNESYSDYYDRVTVNDPSTLSLDVVDNYYENIYNIYDINF